MLMFILTINLQYRIFFLENQEQKKSQLTLFI